MIPNTLPQSLIDNPRLDQWIGFAPGGTVRVRTGKVEIGQGLVTALVQIAAEELDVPPERVALVSGDTDEAPDERYTSGSLSIEVSGSSLRLVCAETRALLLGKLAERLGCPPTELSVRDGAFLRRGVPTGEDYWSLATDVDLARAATGTAPCKPFGDYRVVGRSLARLDLPAKVFGAPFLHDMTFPGMLHARVLRQPCPGARLTALDEAAIRRAVREPMQIVRVGDFVAFVAEDETAVHAAAVAAAAHAVWQGVREISPGEQEAAWLSRQPSIDRVIGPPPPPPSAARVHSATFSRPYHAHAALGPSCALALFRDGGLTVWMHGQGPHPLRQALAGALDLDAAAIVVKHALGPGVYGHNGADDAAMDAAVIAMRMPDRAIRVQWRREEEFGFEPVAPAMLVALTAELDDAGRPADWTTEIWSGTHRNRPGPPNPGPLLARAALPNPPPAPEPADVSDANGGGATRNALPLYDFGRVRIVHHLIPKMPVRTSSMRGLGALANIFAIEGFVDELAALAGRDPVEYRLALLSDRRAIRVIEAAAALAGWQRRPAGGAGHGMGLGVARYKSRSSYVAVVAKVAVEETVRLSRIWCAADAGLVINPDGARNQLEGGIIQAASFVLKEQVKLGGNGVASLDWDSYPILRFGEIPEVEIELIDAPNEPPTGLGEAALGPTAGAIGNAVAHALGIRIRDLPLTRERIMEALLGAAL